MTDETKKIIDKTRLDKEWVLNGMEKIFENGFFKHFFS